MATVASSTVAAFEAKTKFSELLDRVERGEELTITRRGEPVARIVPVGLPDAQRAGEAIERWREYSKGFSLGGLSWKDLRDEGRR